MERLELNLPLTNHPNFYKEITGTYYFKDKSGIYSINKQLYIKSQPFAWGNHNGNGKRLAELPLWFRKLYEQINRMYYPSAQQSKIKAIFSSHKKRPISNIVLCVWGLYGFKEQEGSILDPISKTDEYHQYIFMEPVGAFTEELSRVLNEYDYPYEIDDQNEHHSIKIYNG